MLRTGTPTAPATIRPTPSPFRTTLQRWHLLSLDAPTVAALWTSFIALSIPLHLPFFTPITMFLAVWLLYAADRLLDARQLLHDPLHHDPLHQDILEHRHHFHHFHRRAFLIGIGLTSIALAALLPRILPEALHLYLILGALLAGYFLLIHATGSSMRLPKEFAVGLFFAAATFIPTVARRPELRVALLPPAILFSFLCSLNCLFIYAWEHPSGTSTPHPPHATTHIALKLLPQLTLFTIGLGLSLTALGLGPRPLSAAATLSAALLLLLHSFHQSLSRLTLRAAADLALLTPLLLMPFLHHA